MIQIGDGSPQKTKTKKTNIYSFAVILLQMIMKCNDFGATNHRKSLVGIWSSG